MRSSFMGYQRHWSFRNAWYSQCLCLSPTSTSERESRNDAKKCIFAGEEKRRCGTRPNDTVVVCLSLSSPYMSCTISLGGTVLLYTHIGAQYAPLCALPMRRPHRWHGKLPRGDHQRRTMSLGGLL
jgi:hypothetical protein